MRERSRISAILAAVASGIAACGGSSGGSTNMSGTPGYYISISNLKFSPLDLEAPPGATVTVLNFDSPMTHSVTSEATPGSFTHSTTGISFDTGPISGASASFTLPMTAPAGTVINYFCTVHLGTMNTPNGTITINPNATPSQPPQTFPPGYGY